MEQVTTTAFWILDAVLCGTLVWLAIQTLTAADLFKATVLYIVFGLVMALAWARLNAPDIALVEAALGAGLTGALLLATLASISQPRPGESPRQVEEHR